MTEVKGITLGAPQGNKDFGWAIAELKKGRLVMRTGWNGKGMWLMYVSGDEQKTECDFILRDDSVYEEQTTQLKRLPWIGMRTADGGFVPWLASQTDMLAEDWMGLSFKSTEDL